MNWTIPDVALGGLAAPLFQLGVTLSLGLLCLGLYRRFRKPYFGWWAAAWAIYSLRLVAIVAFLSTENAQWLFWHQVTTGWTALALLWAALVFSQGLRWRLAYAGVLLFPLAWSYVAIYELDQFILAAGPAVLFLSGATFWTAFAFLQHHKRVRSPAALALAAVFFVWALHHLDYPFLRAQGIWNPWGYYLDVLFELGTGLGILLLVQEDLRSGLDTLGALSGDLLRASGDGHVLRVILERPLSLGAVDGTALVLTTSPETYSFGAGSCVEWEGRAPEGPVGDAVARAMRGGRPEVVRQAAVQSFMTVVPVASQDTIHGALVLVSRARDPFAALDDRFLSIVGQQVAAALETSDLNREVLSRREELERLAARTVQQHEEHRRRMSRELHDETAQVFAALTMELGTLKESSEGAHAERVDRALALVSKGITSIRSVADQLRPSVLDDLGLLPALQGLVEDFRGSGGLTVEGHLPETLPSLEPDAELALYRSLQEALSNVARHASARTVSVQVTAAEGRVRLSVENDDDSLTPASPQTGNGTGLAGLTERLTALGGELHFSRHAGVARLEAEVPVVRP